MRIAFDATAILGPMSKNRGIGNYSMGQFTTMIKNDKENSYVFFNLFDDSFNLNDYLGEGVFVEEFKMFLGTNPLAIQGNVEYRDLVGAIVKKFIRDYQIDVFYITSPFDNNCVVYQKEWFEDCKVIALVYDIIPYVMRKHYLSGKESMKWYMTCVDVLRWVDRLQVISQSVKDDLVSYLNFDADKIDVIWGAVDSRYKEIDVPEQQRSELFDKFAIDSSYIMCTGGDDMRKNIAGLIEAYSELSKELIEKYQLVIVCKLSADAEDRYKKLSEKLNVAGRVVFTNFVSNEELLALYNLATIMAFPSIYEGFGLPVVEAWACGTPVLTSENSSLGQIAGDAAVKVNPNSIKDITKGLQYALTDCDLDELLRKGKERLKLFQWDVVAKDSIESIEKLRCEIKIDKARGNHAKKCVAMFTPLPPIESGISDYSVDIIKGLKKYFDIDVYIDDGYVSKVELGENVRVLLHTEFEKNKSLYEEVIYQMGNSEYHFYMYDYIKRMSGIVVLHDYNMHSALYYKSLIVEKSNYDLYSSFLKEDISEEACNDYIHKLQNGQSGAKIYEIELNGAITNYAKKIIVHSFDSKEKLLKTNIERNVYQVWQGTNVTQLPSVDEKKVIRKEKEYEETSVIFGAFGHIHETKRAIPILKAFAKLIKEYKNTRLVFVGKLSDSLKHEFHEIIQLNKLREYVRVTGYTSLEDFSEYMNIIDVVFNLRYPYNGETSASLIRNLERANCVVVNNTGSFAEIPDDACIKLPEVSVMTAEEEIEEIYHVMKNYILQSEKSFQIRKNARAFAEENLNIDTIALEYKKVIESKTTKVITENLLDNITKRCDDEAEMLLALRKLSLTLAWLKEIS